MFVIHVSAVTYVISNEIYKWSCPLSISALITAQQTRDIYTLLDQY